MERIGIRELRQHASTWVARAQSGEVIEIANHGRLVARLIPVEDADADREALIAGGRLDPADERGRPFDPADLIEPDPADHSLSAILQQQREDRQ